ncbi:MAG: outer membrane protein assembly factor BamD [Planctomycetes bacterium]|nr:outer membrane protein assembly factor BamD [Planctomycetota bacterium]
MRIFTGMLAIIVLSTFCVAEQAGQTWQLDQKNNWQSLSGSSDGNYLSAIAKIKQAVANGDEESITAQLGQLKTDYPDLAGPDLDAYIEAELLFAKGKWTRASTQYELFLNSYGNSRLYSAAIDRQFSIGTAFLTGQKRPVLKVFKLRSYDEGEAVMTKIADRTGDAPIAKRAMIAIAESFEQRGKFLDAYSGWAEVSSRWPTGETGKVALLRMAQALHSAYKSPNYDPSSLKSAQSYYRDFKARYPELSEQNNIDDNISLIDQQLAYKQFKIGEYYDRTDSPQAANIYYRSVIESWPGSDAAKMANEKILQNESGKDRVQEPKDLGKKLFDTGNKLLDNWFNPFK